MAQWSLSEARAATSRLAERLRVSALWAVDTSLAFVATMRSRVAQKAEGVLDFFGSLRVF